MPSSLSLPMNDFWNLDYGTPVCGFLFLSSSHLMLHMLFFLPYSGGLSIREGEHSHNFA